jgi:hypothetical protein
VVRNSLLAPIVDTRCPLLSPLSSNGSRLQRPQLPSVRTFGMICKRSLGTGSRRQRWFRYVPTSADWGTTDRPLPGHVLECHACRDGYRCGFRCASYGKGVGRRGKGCEGLVARWNNGSHAPVPGQGYATDSARTWPHRFGRIPIDDRGCTEGDRAGM